MAAIFHCRLKQIRSERMTQAELARLSGLPPSQISHYESGKREPSLANFAILCNALDVSADYLLGRGQATTELIEGRDAKVLLRKVRKLIHENQNTQDVEKRGTIFNKGQE